MFSFNKFKQSVIMFGMSRVTKNKKSKGTALFRLFYFPLLVVWLEMVLHVFMHMQLMFSPIYILYGLSLGFVLTLLTNLWGDKASLTVAKVFSAIITVIYAAEFIAKSILQTFYPFSILGTAADNHLESFIGAILEGIWQNLHVLILFLLPTLLFIIFYKRYKPIRLTRLGFIIISLLLAFLLFVMGLLFVNGNWKMDLTPKILYNTDTGYDDQVEQLGLYNMLRLDIKHMIWPVTSEEDPDPVTPQPLPPAEDEDPSTAKYGYNKMNIDFPAIAASTSNSDIKWLANYFNSVSPTRKNEYTGMMEGYNVILIVVEGMSGYAISEKYTPTLYKMANTGFVFNNFYQALHYTSTSGGECQVLLGLYPKGGNPATMSRTGELKTDTYFSLATQLNRQGYVNIAYHNHIYNLYNRANSHTNLGYKYYYGGMSEGAALIQDKKGWPQRDSHLGEVIVDPNQSISFLNSKLNGAPFNVYAITISGHSSYGWNYAASPHKAEMKDSGYTDKTQAYIATMIEADLCMENLIKGLEKEGRLDKTLFVICGDHIPYANVDILEELSGQSFGESDYFRAINEKYINFEAYHSKLIMWNSAFASENTIQIDKPCCQVDILPTVSNLLGLEYDSRMLAGTDILSESDGLVVFSSNCWKSSLGFYNRFTSKFTLNEGIQMSDAAVDAYVKAMKANVESKRAMTAKIVENNFYKYAVSSGKYFYDPTVKVVKYKASDLESMYLNKGLKKLEPTAVK